ncbi:hypothetical protein Tco_0734842 [Tanacetum coccineum]
MDNIADPLMKGLSRELVRESSKGIRLKPLKEKEFLKKTLPILMEIPRSRCFRQISIHVGDWWKPDTELNVTGFCDASWQSDKDDTKSQMTEYMAASEAAMEAVWIRKFVGDLRVMPSIKKPIDMYCDNSAAIIFANDSGVMKGARHFLRRYHYVRAVQDVEAWKHSDFLCHNYVLNGLVGSLYNVYCKTTTAKELWESLERKHKTKDAGTKKFYRNLVEFL